MRVARVVDARRAHVGTGYAIGRADAIDVTGQRARRARRAAAAAAAVRGESERAQEVVPPAVGLAGGSGLRELIAAHREHGLRLLRVAT